MQKAVGTSLAKGNVLKKANNICKRQTNRRYFGEPAGNTTEDIQKKLYAFEKDLNVAYAKCACPISMSTLSVFIMQCHVGKILMYARDARDMKMCGPWVMIVSSMAGLCYSCWGKALCYAKCMKCISGAT